MINNCNFVFLHVPKCAGTALRTLMCDVFVEHGLTPEKMCPIRDRRLGAMQSQALAAYQVFSGHFYFDQILRIPDPVITVTLLREPRARLISLYNHLRSTTWGRIDEIEAEGGDSPRLAKSLAFVDYLRRKDFVVQINIDNALTRHLIGLKYMDASGNLTISDDGALNAALSNLERFTEVGLVEHSAEFLRRLGRLLDVDLPATLPVRNSLRSIVERNRRYEWVEPVVSVDAETEAALQRNIRIDRRVYAYALAKQPAAG